MQLFNFKGQSKDKYYNHIIKENNKNPYSFERKYLKQEHKLLKLYGKSDTYSKKIKIIVISDTHNSLNENDFKQFIHQHKSFDICILLGDHNSNDLSIILKYIENNKIYGLLGNHDYNYLEDYNIKNLNGKVINVNGTTILGIQGSFKYKPVGFPSFTQRESILFFNDKPKVDILVSHDNAFDNNMIRNPAHQGLFGITYYLFKNRIPYHIHGHIHNPYKKEKINGTKEISVYMYEYLELGIKEEREMEIINNNKNLENDILEGKYLNREMLLSKLGYLKEYEDKINSYPSKNDFILNELKIIKNELVTNQCVDKPYVPCIRAQSCINEFTYYLKRDQIEDSLFDIYEVIESDKYPAPFYKEYKYSIYISDAEKSIIFAMVNMLESKIKNIDNNFSSKVLYQKAKQFIENEYGISKFLSLPLLYSHNKLISLILISSDLESNLIYSDGYILIDKNSGEIEFKSYGKKSLSTDEKLSVLNTIPKVEININNKEKLEELKDKYFELLDYLILMYGSKKEFIETDKISDFINIYKNIELEKVQIYQSLENEFLSSYMYFIYNPNSEIARNYNIVDKADEGLNEIDEKIVEEIYKEIEKLQVGIEFTLQQFMKKYDIDEKDKFRLCKQIFAFCSNNNVQIVEKIPGADLGLPWNIPRIRG